MKAFLRKNIIVILVVLVVALAFVAVYFYKQSTGSDAKTRQAIAEAKNLSKKVGRLMVLPEGETPTIATVSDPEALKDQEFFVEAKVGDKVLIYSNAKKAILFDPKANKIINVAPLNTNQQTPTQGASLGEIKQ